MRRSDKSACEVIQTVIHDECSTPPTHKRLISNNKRSRISSPTQIRSRTVRLIKHTSPSNSASQWLGIVTRGVMVGSDVISRRTWP